MESHKNWFTNLINIKKNLIETIEDYLHRFQKARSHSFTKVAKNEIVKIVVASFNFAIKRG